MNLRIICNQNYFFAFLHIQLNAAIFYPMALALGAEALVSIRRIEEFLQKDEKNETELGLERRSSVIVAGTKGKIESILFGLIIISTFSFSTNNKKNRKYCRNK